MADGLTQALVLFASAFAASSFAGLAALLRFGKRITPVTVLGAMLNSGLLGLSVMLFWYEDFHKTGSLYSLMAICILSGLGGTGLLDFVLFVLRKGGLEITINHDHHDHQDRQDQRRKR